MYCKSFFLCRDRCYLQISCAILLTCLAGCGKDVSDLKQYIEKVKAEPKGRIQPLPEIKIIEPFLFSPKDQRDPFKPPPVQPERQDAPPELSVGSGLRPNTNRRKEEMEAFPLETLKMVGTITMKSKLWGLVKADDGTIHRLQVGNYMGKNYGKISRISADKIELVEIVPDRPGKWREQQSSLGLTE